MSNDEPPAGIARLKEGRWTPEEIQSIRHDSYGAADARAFADGRTAERRKIYAYAPDACPGRLGSARTGPSPE